MAFGRSDGGADYWGDGQACWAFADVFAWRLLSAAAAYARMKSSACGAVLPLDAEGRGMLHYAACVSDGLCFGGRDGEMLLVPNGILARARRGATRAWRILGGWRRRAASMLCAAARLYRACGGLLHPAPLLLLGDWRRPG